MSTPTAARVHQESGSHWYYTDGRSCYELPKADGKGMKKPTLADARKLNLVPGVSSILKVLDKPALTAWLIEQAVLAVITAPRQAGEADDVFVKRVLHDEEQQREESNKARDKGTAIHAALSDLFAQKVTIDQTGELRGWIEPAYDWMRVNAGPVIGNETILSGEGYSGMTDLVTCPDSENVLWDFKSAKKLPDPAKGGWPEHKLQLAAYGKAWSRERGNNYRAANVYISTTDMGKFVVCEYSHEHLIDAYHRAFQPLVSVWQYLNNYKPTYV
jgi:hypothetical protein